MQFFVDCLENNDAFSLLNSQLRHHLLCTAKLNKDLDYPICYNDRYTAYLNDIAMKRVNYKKSSRFGGLHLGIGNNFE